jgi:methionyl-tRNA synthetase
MRLISIRRLRHPESDCIFSTGTDEHGLKIQQAAALAGQLIKIQ